jgi:CRISPR-associated protein Csb2
MSGLTIGWEYLTGYAVATDPASRERAEWPPHPARVFMALAAAWFEIGEDAAEGEALRWLETLGDPRLHLPPYDRLSERSNVTVYVPVNNKSGPAAATLQSAPSMTRSKQPRTFPRVYVGNTPVYMNWPEANGAGDYRNVLDRLCAKVTRIGHSSSLVRMWLGTDSELSQAVCEKFVIDDIGAEIHVRQISQGLLDTLIENFGEGPRRYHKKLQDDIKALNTEKKAIRGKGSTDRKAEVEERLKLLKEALDGLAVHSPVHPRIGLWSGYRKVDCVKVHVDVQHSYFDTDLLVLAHIAGPILPLASTLAVTKALRGTVLARAHQEYCGCGRWLGGLPAPAQAAECYAGIPAWVSGHGINAERLGGESGHLAYVPLPFVGPEYADGHLLGMGLAFPRSVERRERGRVLGKLLLKETGEPRPVELNLGHLGVWTLLKSDWSERRDALQPGTWTAHPAGATTWASVTPVVLDKFPKTDRRKDRSGWTEEVADIIATACGRIGLPDPESIDIGTTCWHRGVARAIGKRRQLRGQSVPGGQTDTPLGDGFPPYPPKGTNVPRVQVHVWLRFSEPVVGPVLLGAGRFQGYGLCKPWQEEKL